MATATALFVLLACVLVNVYSIEELNVTELAEIAEETFSNTSVNTCDETNTQNSFIYCHGRLLAAVNIHNLFNDSKFFVDMPMKSSPEVVRDEFDRRFGEYELKAINRTALKEFIAEFFEQPGNELDECQLDDWNEHPKKLMNIRDPKLRNWALELNAIWKSLCRKMKANENPNRTSLIPVREEFIVPGGRFREFYYWDAYWIVKGLIACGLHNTTKKMITNLASVVDRYGFVPNGGRVYYLGRSQPPFLTPMAYEYFEATGDLSFIKEILPSLIREYEFWENNRVINVTDDEGNEHSVYYYHSKCNVPRPESYRTDIVHASRLKTDERQKFYVDIASAAESGWDFSSRWFKDQHKIETIETTDIIPIDLNALICWNMDILQYLLHHTGKHLGSRMFREKREVLKEAMTHVFYNTTEGSWFDYNLRTKSHNMKFYPSMVVPLFGQCYQQLDLVKPQRIIKYLNKLGVFDYGGGIPTSLIQGTDQQWDFPNGWSPTIHMIIEGMRKSGNPEAQEQAFRLARKWVLGNYKVFQETHSMWEKYDVNDTTSQPGGGGEYEVQAGFGWSNGVILDLLTTYYDRLSVESNYSLNSAYLATNRIRSIQPILLLMVASAFYLHFY